MMQTHSLLLSLKTIDRITGVKFLFLHTINTLHMGDMADYYREQEMDNFMDEMELEDIDHDMFLNDLRAIEKQAIAVRDTWESYNNGTLKWTTKDNQHILIQEMSTIHIQNSIRYLERQDKGTSTSANILRAELGKRIINHIL